MTRLLLASAFLVGALVAAIVAPDASAQPKTSSTFVDKPTADQLAFFEKKIRPVLVDHCYKCHSAEAEKVKAEFFLDTRDGLRKGAAGGPPIIPGSPEKSKLIAALKHRNPETAMPPKGKLPDSVIADFETWIKMGAPDPRDGKAVAVGPKYVVDIEKGRQFWSFVAPKNVSPPELQKPKFEIRSDIDKFIATKWEEKGLTPVGDADKRTLLRRVYLDLTGLPPTVEEVEAFVADKDANAFEKVV
ncbi:MAG: DUF1549 domain-containing protein, partial [Planctomycetia bacterium]|nr:DUF1549 domain-containing protein [Planctomycetia bacterium]